MQATINRPHRYELADILREGASAYLDQNSLCPVQAKAIKDITACRTSQMKGHLSQCNSCGHTEQSYNSCRNRHCNKCQFIKQTQWVDKLKAKLIPGKYFHLVFTVPDSLNPLFYLNQELCYSLLFKVAWSALRDLCHNPRFLGAQTGAVAVLHTWSSTMVYHPHIHMLVPAGGLSEDGIEWIKTKNDYLVPVKVLSKIYRARFCDQMKTLFQNNALRIPEGTRVNDLMKVLFEKQWVVYAKKTGKTVDHALEYLARYTNRVAISNDRITEIAQGKVSFRYKDPKTGKYNKLMTLDTYEFIRRFLQHILPSGFYKIRYFGILASVNNNSSKEQSLAAIDKDPPASDLEGLNTFETILLITGRDLTICTVCNKGRMMPSWLANTG
ncbi:MAG: IS91 family transposase [Bacteroidales bacterium]|nr:IS91 family transposase [Bacteroidales bacterium]